MELDCSQTNNSSFILANFTNGTLKQKSAGNVAFACFQSKSNSVSPEEMKRKILVAEAKGMRYTGQNFGFLAPTNRKQSKYMVGVLDKTTGKMKLYDTDMFNMKPESKEDTEEEDLKERTYMEKQDELTAAFGSSRKKRSMASRQKNMLKDDALQEVVGSAVDTALKDPSAETILSMTNNQQNETEIPPHDVTATKPQDAYKLSSIISEVEMEALESAAQVFVSSDRKKVEEWTQQETYPCHILAHLKRLPIREEDRLRRAKCLLYLHYMFILYRLKAVDFRKKGKDPFPDDVIIPNIIKKWLLEKFTLQPEASSKRVMTARCKDKLLSYMLILCLIIDEFNLDYSELLKDLKMSYTRMNVFLKALGCKVTTKRQTTPLGEKQITVQVTLPLPLTFPEVKKPMGKKRT